MVITTGTISYLKQTGLLSIQRKVIKKKVGCEKNKTNKKPTSGRVGEMGAWCFKSKGTCLGEAMTSLPADVIFLPAWNHYTTHTDGFSAYALLITLFFLYHSEFAWLYLMNYTSFIAFIFHLSLSLALSLSPSNHRA